MSYLQKAAFVAIAAQVTDRRVTPARRGFASILTGVSGVSSGVSK